MTWHHHRRGAYLPPGTPSEESDMASDNETQWSQGGIIVLFLVTGLLVLACCLGGLWVANNGGAC